MCGYDLRCHIQTCKCLLGASKTKFVWQAIANKELSHNSNHPSELFLERPINTYTAQELEHLILRWKSAEIGWKTDDGVPARERKLQLEREPGIKVECIHLVKGGRWLLVGLSSGSVLFYDLDEKDPIQHTLIAPSGSTIRLDKMRVDIDTSSPTLAFKLALLSTRRLGSIKYMVEVWHISLAHETNSDSSPLTLLAQQLMSFHPEPHDFVGDISILGNHLAYSVSGEKACYVIVVRWTNLEETPSNFEKWIQPTNHIWVYVCLLPGDRLLTRKGKDIGMYNIHSFLKTKEIPSYLWASRGSPVVWVASPERRTREEFLTNPFICKDSIRMVTATNREVHGVIFQPPDDISGKVGELITLGDIPRGFFGVVPAYPSYGYRYSALWCNSMLTLIYHPWPDDSDESSGSYTIVQKQSAYKGNAIITSDVGAGRIVAWNRTLVLLELGQYNP
ncbi:hypothetical protein AX16_010051 [Volvariella volvacea WC 439]|nr:hypothetical protein AX16_010051 [Volvariella volvacea WC 439]